MADYIIKESQLTAIADGARHVTGSTEKMTVTEMAENLQNYEAYQILDANWTGDLIAEGVKTLMGYGCLSYINVYDSTTDVAEKRGNRIFKKVSLPNCTEAFAYAFFQSTILESLNLPALTTAGGYMFHSADLSGVTELNFPALTTAGGYMFHSADLSGVTELNFPALTRAGTHMFYNADLSGVTEASLNELLSKTETSIDKSSIYNGSVFGQIKTSANKLKCKWGNMGVSMFGQLKNPDDTKKTVIKLWISKETKVRASYASEGIFYEYSTAYTSVDIYTDAEEKPSIWGDYFDNISQNIKATVHYGVSEEEYDAL